MNKIILLIVQRAMIIVGASLIVYSLYAPTPLVQVDFPMVNKFITNGGIVNGKEVLFPFIVNLKTSKIVYDKPTLSVYQSGSWTLAEGQGKPVAIESRKKFTLMRWTIVVDMVYNSALWYKDRYVQKEVPDGVPAAFVHATDSDGSIRSGWIYSGSTQFAPQNLDLGDSLVLVLSKSKALTCWSDILIMRDRYSSEVDPTTMFLEKVPYVRVDSFILEGNKSRSFMDGWNIKMLSYEHTKFNQPDKIIFRVSKNSFEWKRYLGAALLLIGAVWLWTDRKRPV